MEKLLKIVFLLFSFFFLIYLIFPFKGFPDNPEGVLQSDEPADTESIEKIAFFTNLNRDQIIAHYYTEFATSLFQNIPGLTLRLNYPPEESQTIIRDQTRSSFLEEIVHPFRESIYVNGFLPKEEKDKIFIGGYDWKQKITIKYVESNVIARLLIGVATLFLIATQYALYKKNLPDLIKVLKLTVVLKRFKTYVFLILI